MPTKQKLSTLVENLPPPLADGEFAALKASIKAKKAPRKRDVTNRVTTKKITGQKTITVMTMTNTIGMELVLIPAGSFQMGSPASEKDQEGYAAQVDVTLTKSFYLGKTMVTQGQWWAVMGTTTWKGEEDVREGDNYPATCMTWKDAKAFCKKLSKKEKMTYRLPTEAEWEYACRAGTTTRFSFGDDESQLGEFAWCRKNAWDINEKYPHEVGRKKANPFGLYDMHGNACEWCEDVYANELRGGTDPLVSEGGWIRMIVRGGNILSGAAACQSAHRVNYSPDDQGSDLGFRVAQVPGSQ